VVVPGQREDSPPLLSMPTYTPPLTLSDTTRRLCCAPYVDVHFGNAVIREVVESERKAVPPSFDFDVDPVVRHCLRARRLVMARYAVVTVLLVLGLFINIVWTIAWLALCVAIVALRSSAVRQLPRPVRIGLVTTAAVVLLCFLGTAVVQLLITSVVGGGSAGLPFPLNTGSGGESPGQTLDGLFGAGVTGFRQVAPLLLAAVMFLVLYLSRRHAYGILSTELAPGARVGVPGTGNGRVEWRLGVVAAMQRGNISVHETDPFAGGGQIAYGWSFAISLKPRRETDGDASRRRRTGRVQIDGAALNWRVAEAVVGLRDLRLRDGERIPNVYVVPHVAADGVRRNDDPLIDPQTRVPRTLASPETIAAILACPQGGLRHYLRAVVPAHGKEIRTPQGLPVLPAQDSGVGVTAFVHLAVEGGMLYAEFMATVMPGVAGKYHLVDNLRPERVQARAVVDTLREFVTDNLLGPVWLVQTGWHAMRLQSRMARSARKADEYRYYDYGARFSVREAAADWDIVKFLQQLDAWKYTKLLDKTVSEAIVDFLDDSGVDTTDFSAAVTQVRNQYGSFQTFNGGIQNLGGTNTNIQNNMPGGGHGPSTGAKAGGGSHG
jgi:hypothetical protein